MRLPTTTTSTVLICDTEPIAINGLCALLRPCPDLRIVETGQTLAHALDTARTHKPTLAIVDKGFGIRAVMEWVHALRQDGGATAPIVWGLSVNETEALRFIQTGARGVIRKTADLDTVLACVRAVAAGQSWLEPAMLREISVTTYDRYSRLTPRELHVLELVERGLRNKEIAAALGIRAATVHIHVKHIFEKTGVRGRAELALSGAAEARPKTILAM